MITLEDFWVKWDLVLPLESKFSIFLHVWIYSRNNLDVDFVITHVFFDEAKVFCVKCTFDSYPRSFFWPDKICRWVFIYSCHFIDRNQPNFEKAVLQSINCFSDIFNFVSFNINVLIETFLVSSWQDTQWLTSRSIILHLVHKLDAGTNFSSWFNSYLPKFWIIDTRKIPQSFFLLFIKWFFTFVFGCKTIWVRFRNWYIIFWILWLFPSSFCKFFLASFFSSLFFFLDTIFNLLCFFTDSEISSFHLFLGVKFIVSDFAGFVSSIVRYLFIWTNFSFDFKELSSCVCFRLFFIFIRFWPLFWFLSWFITFIIKIIFRLWFWSFLLNKLFGFWFRFLCSFAGHVCFLFFYFINYKK